MVRSSRSLLLVEAPKIGQVIRDEMLFPFSRCFVGGITALMLKSTRDEASVSSFDRRAL